MSHNRSNIVSQVGRFVRDVVAGGQAVAHSRKRQSNDLRSAWIDADRMIGFCKF